MVHEKQPRPQAASVLMYGPGGGGAVKQRILSHHMTPVTQAIRSSLIIAPTSAECCLEFAPTGYRMFPTDPGWGGGEIEGFRNKRLGKGTSSPLVTGGIQSQGKEVETCGSLLTKSEVALSHSPQLGVVTEVQRLPWSLETGLRQLPADALLRTLLPGLQ